MDPRLKAWLIGVVSVGWLVNLCAPVVIRSYESNLVVNAPLMLILGAVFATRDKGGEGK